ncbi:MAG: acyl-CoA dehydrogenase family protein [Sandarakinorhabdus sp.]|nr:acyl-CoA dehydrogenase family protein [Sandarakinorhabdus sp.]
MDFNDTPQEAAFRRQAREWLAANAPAHVLPAGVKLDDADEVARGRAWQKALFDGGYAGILLPRALGGRGGTIIEAVVFGEEEGRFNLPRGPYVGIGLGMALPVLGKHGRPAQIERFAAPTLRGEMTWCQLFSEPGAGSDLAAVRTRAVKDGDGWIINGQKVWSSWAHQADWAILVARTDPSVPKHKGLTFFVIDMKSPGIEIRPIRQISGASDFNETFLTDVRVPDDCRIGAEGEGWACCMTVLMGERLNQGGAEKGGVELLVGLLDSQAPGAMDDPAARQALAEAIAEERAEKYFQARLRTMVSRGENPGAYAAMVKLASASRLQKTSALAMELLGHRAIAAGPDEAGLRGLWHDYIWSTALRVAGGADEVLRNQIAERVLGMPGDVRADKDVPFDQLR